ADFLGEPPHELLHDLHLERIAPRLQRRPPFRVTLLCLNGRGCEQQGEHQYHPPHGSSSSIRTSSCSTESSWSSERPCSSGSCAAAQLTASISRCRVTPARS